MNNVYYSHNWVIINCYSMYAFYFSFNQLQDCQIWNHYSQKASP